MGRSIVVASLGATGSRCKDLWPAEIEGFLGRYSFSGASMRCLMVALWPSHMLMTCVVFQIAFCCLFCVLLGFVVYVSLFVPACLGCFILFVILLLPMDFSLHDFASSEKFFQGHSGPISCDLVVCQIWFGTFLPGFAFLVIFYVHPFLGAF